MRTRHAALLLLAALFAAGMAASCDRGKLEAKSEEERKAEDNEVFRIGIINAFAGDPALDKVLYYAEAYIQDSIVLSWANSDANTTRSLSLAESVDISPNQKEAVITIRDNAFFHNGAPVTANDVIWSLEDIIKSNPALYSSAINKDILMDIISERTLRFSSDIPTDWMSLFGATIRNAEFEKSVEDADSQLHKPIGAGPYRFVEYDRKKGIIRLERFEKYWGGTPKFEKLEVHLFNNHDAASMALFEKKIDYFFQVPQETADIILNNADYVLFSVTMPYLNQMVFNVNSPKLADWRVRRALALLLNRRQILKDARLEENAIPADAPLYITEPQTPPKAEPPDYDRAFELLAEAGWRPGKNRRLMKDGQRFILDIAMPKHSARYLLALRAVASQFNEAGIDCTLRSLDMDNWLQLLDTRNFEAVFVDYVDTNSLLGSKERFISDGASNLSGQQDKTLDDLYTRLFDGKIGKKELKQNIQKRIREKTYVVGLFYPKWNAALSSKYNNEIETVRKDPYYLRKFKTPGSPSIN